ncbi:type 1 glutamine amidotransferase [Candidatus Woesearchaeota archaeon]|nr:type 1 glutamine amidotransferase [Candidatus Woesearchaeota archaeon]
MIGIINCDLDNNPNTNGASLLNNLIENSEIVNLIEGEIPSFNYSGFIITGSRANYNDEYEWISSLRRLILEIDSRNIPCLGICFGMQVIADVFHGSVIQNEIEENGFFRISISDNSLFENFEEEINVFESHHDVVSEVPINARVIAENENCIQGFQLRNLYGIQFHPEITFDVARLMDERDGTNYSSRVNENDGIEVINNFIRMCENE